MMHQLRFVAVSGGDSLYLVGKVLGYRQSPTTERYTHLKDEPRSCRREPHVGKDRDHHAGQQGHQSRSTAVAKGGRIRLPR
jgi:hypothetical protein